MHTGLVQCSGARKSTVAETAMDFGHAGVPGRTGTGSHSRQWSDEGLLIVAQGVCNDGSPGRGA
jgi:hypothetical protein